MESQSKQEIERCRQFLDRTDISEHDREMAERGLNDWFWESVFDEIDAFEIYVAQKRQP